MKTKIIENRIFTAYMLNGNGAPKLEVHQNDGAKAAAVLGPNDFVPGLEPSSGLTAVDLLAGVGGFISDKKRNELKPAVRRAVEKFMKSPRETKTPEQKAESDRKNEIASVAIELNEAAAVLDLVMNSEMIIGSDGDAESFEQLRYALWHLAPVFIEKSRKLYGLTIND